MLYLYDQSLLQRRIVTLTDTATVQTKRRWYFLAAALILLPLLSARGVGIANSFLATDVRYMDTVWPTLLYYLRQLFSVLFLGVSFAALAAATFRFGKKSGTAVLSLSAGLYFADTAAAFLIDVISGAVSGRVLLALLSGLGSWLFWAVLLWFSRIVAGRCAVRGRTPEQAVLWSAALCAAVRLLMETAYLLQFLIEVEFLPYATEIAVIAGEYLSIVFFYGGLVWLSTRGLLPCFLSAGVKNEKT